MKSWFLLTAVLGVWLVFVSSCGANEPQNSTQQSPIVIQQWQPVYAPAQIVAVPRVGLFGRVWYRLYIMPAGPPQQPQQTAPARQPPLR